MTVKVKGPINHLEIELCDLGPGDGFIDPKNKALYIYLEEDGNVIECLKLHPCLGTFTLNCHLLVRQVDINIEWSYR